MSRRSASRQNKENISILGRRVPVQLKCQDNKEFVASLPRGSVQLVVTSPPYNIGKEYERGKIFPSIDEWKRDQHEIVSLCAEATSSEGSLCWQVGNYVDRNGEIFPLDIMLYEIFKEKGLYLRNRIVWTYGHGTHSRNRFSGRHETIMWFTKSRERTTPVFNLDAVRVPQLYPWKTSHKGPNKGRPSCNPLGKNPSDVWDIPNVKHNHVEKTSHPCQFPVALAERLVLALSNPGDVVLDPYAGVGSTLVAAVKHNRQAFGCDIVPEYVETAASRLNALLRDELRLRPDCPPIRGSRAIVG